MKLMTFNTHSWLEQEQLQKLETLAEHIAKVQYDVIALQEVNQLITSEIVKEPLNFIPSSKKTTIKTDNFALLLIKLLHEKYQLDYYWSYAYNHIGYDKYDEGTAILSKHHFDTATLLPFSKTTDPTDFHTRVGIGINLQINQIDYAFYSLHTSWWKDENDNVIFPQEADKFTKLQDDDTVVMLLGDFNNPSQIRNEGYDFMLQNWLDTYQLAEQKDGTYTMGGNIAGWDHNQEPLRIDFIFSSQNVKVKEAKILFDGRNEKPLSDHFLYSIEII